MPMKRVIAGVSTIVMVVGGLAAVATPDAHADQAAGHRCFTKAVLGCVWLDTVYNGAELDTTGPKVHGFLGLWTMSSPWNNSISSVASCPGKTAYTEYYDPTNGQGTPMFTLWDGWMQEALGGNDNRISSIVYSPSNL